MPTTCPICTRRRGKRFCPGLAASRWGGKSETICAPCCGEQREVTIDCPADCPYLVAAHRYEAERPPRSPSELPFPQVGLDRDFLDEQQEFLAALSLFLGRLATEQADLHDPDLLAALDGLARSYQTLEAGLYYEQPPEGVPARAVYTALQGFLSQLQQERAQTGAASLRPADILRAVVFFRRLGARGTNARPLSRVFLNSLRAQLPAAARPGASRLILPGG